MNQNMCSQTMACITKLSCEISAILRYYAALSGNSLPSFQDNLSVPSSKVKKSKREKRVWLKLQDTIFFFGTCPTSNFLKKHDISEASSVPFSGKETPNLVDPLDWAIQNHWAP
jgi:hypothetical protein